ncbi:MAG: hypothetical protein A2283_21540 [Lentisphaerae bacterium RIFOXYA12_FULL_48_11]|nr:MAG: hypothetical protein A2283_21540 [Lentisphaerae bacterium RIFOXYA12_FULL_48_11]
MIRTKWMVILAIWTVAGIALAERTASATFYVDSDKGSDTAEGTAENSAWQSLERVNNATLIPGDQILFKRGGLWRGQFFPQSGSNGTRIVYGAYGSGEKPIIQGSVARNRPDEWSRVSPGIWATQQFEPKLLDQVKDLTDSKWNIHSEAGAKVTLARVQEEGRSFNRITCKAPGKAGNHIQVWGPQLAETAPCLVLRLRMRSTLPFQLESVSTILNHSPYTGAMHGTVGKKKIGPEWQTFDILMLEQKKLEGTCFHFNLGNVIPADAVFDFEPVGIWRASIDHCTPVSRDVGILILNHGEKWGVKKWKLEDLKVQLDYWYDPEGKRIFVACDANPAAKFKSIELALTAHIVNQGGKHDITYDGLAVRYGGAHGFGGGSTKRITIRNCDVYWIGGGLQFWKKVAGKPDRPVRFGNGIEFWGNAEDNLVEYNRLWEVYDAALTNQGRDDEEVNITYRHNIIWNSEYSFEFWNAKKTANILFEYNTCVDAGFCWSHNQRPDINGGHLMFYHNRSATTNFVIRNNIFANSTEVCIRMENDWRSGLTLNNNLYYQAEKPIIRWLSKNYYTGADFARYQSELGMDTGSLHAAPQFVDPAARDYRLKSGSPGTTLATDGGPVGARQFTQKDVNK